jgi:hypothetical protein
MAGFWLGLANIRLVFSWYMASQAGIDLAGIDLAGIWLVSGYYLSGI